MSYYGAVHCDGLPEVAVYRGESSDVLPPVRLYADEERDLLVLQSDVPVSPSGAPRFADCVTGWFADNDVFPLYLSGLAEEKNGVPELYGIATGDAAGAGRRRRRRVARRRRRLRCRTTPGRRSSPRRGR